MAYPSNENAVFEQKFIGVHSLIEGLKKDVTDIRVDLKEIRGSMDKVHLCNKEDVIDEIRESIGSWFRWWRGILITIVIGTFVLGGWVYSVNLQKEKIVSLEQSFVKVEEEVRSIGVSQKELVIQIRKDESKDKSTWNSRKQELGSMFKGLLKEALPKSKGKHE